MSLNWRGDEVQRSVERAARVGINATLTECVSRAKDEHPYENRTGTAERSVRIIAAARAVGNAVVGAWGSISVRYFRFLEYGHGLRFASLVPAARTLYPRLAANIRAAMRTA